MHHHKPIRRLHSPLARARGLGSAKEGVHHWWMQRMSAVALIPLTIWFICSAIMLAGATQADVRDWLSRPASAILMSLLILSTFYHAALGVQVVIEDYVHREGVKLVSMVLAKGLIALVGAAALFAVLRIAFGA